MTAVDIAKESKQASVETTCQCFGLHRDSYYKYKQRHSRRLSVEKQVIELVKQERIEQPRVGTRKLLLTLHTTFNLMGLKVGRDELFRILRKYDMLVRRKKSGCKTTDSYHRFHKYNNLIKDFEITRNSLFVFKKIFDNLTSLKSEFLTDNVRPISKRLSLPKKKRKKMPGDDRRGRVKREITKLAPFALVTVPKSSFFLTCMLIHAQAK